MTPSELVVKYIFKADTTKLNDFIKGIGELNMSSIMAGLGIGALGETIALTAKEIGKLMEHGESTARWMKNFTAMTGESSQVMKKWKDMAEEMGLNGEALVGTIVKLSEQKLQLPFNAGLRQQYYQLELATHGLFRRTDSAFKQLIALAKAIEIDPKNKETIMYLARGIGVGVELNQLLLMNDKDRLTMMERMSALTDKQVDSLNKSAAASERLKKAWGDIGDRIAAALSKGFEGKETEYASFLETLLKGGKGARDALASFFLKSAGQTAFQTALSPTLGLTGAQAVMTGGAAIKNYAPTFHIHGPMEAIIAKIDEYMKKMLRDAEYQKAPV